MGTADSFMHAGVQAKDQSWRSLCVSLADESRGLGLLSRPCPKVAGIPIGQWSVDKASWFVPLSAARSVVKYAGIHVQAEPLHGSRYSIWLLGAGTNGEG